MHDKVNSHQLDAVEQDSLEITNIDSNKSNEVTTEPFYPFAKIGSKWSNDGAAQNSTNTFNNTNQDVENNTTNEFAEQTNSSIDTNQTYDEEDIRDLPGIIQVAN